MNAKTGRLSSGRGKPYARLLQQTITKAAWNWDF